MIKDYVAQPDLEEHDKISTRKRYYVWGRQKGKGFKIWDSEVCVKSSSFGKPTHTSKRDWLCTLAVVVAIILIMTLGSSMVVTFSKAEATLWNLIKGWIFAGSLIGLITFFPMLLSFKDEERQWHGCEHKVYYLLFMRWQLNLENLKQAKRAWVNRKHGKCGSAFLSPIFGFSLCGLLVSLSIWCIPVAIFLGIMVWFYFPYLVERFIVTKEPTEAQLKEGLEVAKKFVALKENH